MAAVAIALLAGPATADPPDTVHAQADVQESVGSELSSGEELRPGDYLASPSGQYEAGFDEGGDLIEVHQNWQLWGLDRTMTDPRLVMQSDGNAVVYSSRGAEFWTGTAGHPGAWLVLQDDGNMVVYSASGRALWQNAAFSDFLVGLAPDVYGEPVNGVLEPGHYLITPDRRWRLVMQQDGNLVLYAPTGQPRWWTGTSGHPGSRLVAQSDGNVVLYSAADTPLWQTGTRMRFSEVELRVQSDGNVVLYETSGSGESVYPIWQSGTNR